MTLSPSPSAKSSSSQIHALPHPITHRPPHLQGPPLPALASCAVSSNTSTVCSGNPDFLAVSWRCPTLPSILHHLRHFGSHQIFLAFCQNWFPLPWPPLRKTSDWSW